MCSQWGSTKCFSKGEMTTFQRIHPHQTLSAESYRVWQKNTHLTSIARSDLNISNWVQMRNFKHSSASAVQSKRGRSFPPLRPRSWVRNSVCFHFPWYEASCRLELCVWRWGRFVERGWKLWAGRRPFAWCLGYPRGEERGERVGLYVLTVSGYSSVYICCLERSGSCLSKIHC